MTINEFKEWLRGYVEGGGNDCNRIFEESQKLVDPVPINFPYVPITFPDPFTSNPWYSPTITWTNT